MMTTNLRNKMRGSLMGGAIGDALGYPVKAINSYAGIQAKYGMKGITRMDITRWWLDNEELEEGKALVTDKTQMTLYTAWGLLNAASKEENVNSVREACIEWYLAQVGWRNTAFEQSWLRQVEGLNERRDADYTSLLALKAAFTDEFFFSRSNGNAGMTRIAPVALFAVANGTDILEADQQAAEIAKITHLDPLAYIAAALECHIIYRLATDTTSSREKLAAYIQEGMNAVKGLYAEETEALDRLQGTVNKALALAATCTPSTQAVESIGEGKFADEALAIALYCSLKHFGNFEAAITAAVNHKGASEATGAITGNILGTAVGYNALPSFYTHRVELEDVIMQLADALWTAPMFSQEMPESAQLQPVADNAHYVAC